MAKAHYITPRVPQAAAKTVRLGATFAAVDEGKLMKLSAESEYALCVAGDPIEAVLASVDTATSGGKKIGSVYEGGGIYALADGLQATPGTGAIAVGDFVVAGTVTAIGASLNGFPKVCKATNQPGTVPADLTAAGQQARNGVYAWRVASLGTVGTGAVGTTIVIERANAA